MKHIKKKISNIIGELTMFFFSIGATDISLELQDKDEKFILYLRCNYSDAQEAKISKLVKALQCPKGEAIEEHYWGLAGNSEWDVEFTLIGVMVDDFEITYKDNLLKLILVKNK
ncbi:hypothetical protein [Clostridium thermarum]|uniref:hypothetical protein n=1 Tax=Clostridium thermarum TaxID=1716543 RepID=UPI00111F5291|nr:hypothetical protein [Clostridium thermarum]